MQHDYKARKQGLPIMPLLVSVIVLCVATGELIGWLYVPEVRFLGALKRLM